MRRTERMQRAESADGTEIVGRVRGGGPPLVLIHGSLEDGDLLWGPMLPYLEDRFTCYLPSTRGRGLSAGNADLSPARLVEDVVAIAESVGEPVGLVGESAGGMLALGAAARSEAVAAVAAYEPVVLEAQSEEDAAALSETVERVARLAESGRLADAARTFAEPLLNDAEQAELAGAGLWERCGRYVPVLLQELEALGRSQEPGPTSPAVLEGIDVPVLLLYGSRSALRHWFEAGVRHVDDEVADARVREVAGTGHWAPVLAPASITAELESFFGEGGWGGG